MQVSVIVVNWNGKALLQRCLDSLFRQTYRQVQIIVVDNGSTDGSLEWLTGLPGIDLVTLPENRGFAGGNNAAWPRVKGDLVGLLNNDAVAHPRWIEAAVGDVAQGWGMVACRILRRGAETIDKVGHLMFADGQNRGQGTGQSAAAFLQSGEALWPDGCAAFFSREVIETIGFFDDRFFLYAEDADLGFRARWAGFRCRYNAQSVVYHGHSQSLGKFHPLKIYYIERNRLWLLVKNMPAPLLLLSPVMTFYRYLAMAFSLVRGSGVAAEFSREQGAWVAVQTIVRAWRDGLVGLMPMWRQRKKVQRKLSRGQMMALLWRFRLSWWALSQQD